VRARRAPRARGARYAVACCVAGAALAVAVASAAPAALCPQAQALGKGIIDNRLEESSLTANAPALVGQIGRDGLGAKWTRVLVHWSSLQPSSADRFNQTYADQLTTVVGAFKAQGVTVIMTLVDVPKWASKTSLWSSPPKGFKKGVYAPFYAMDIKRAAVRDGFTRLGQYLAANYPVRYFECWNEPNLGSCLYPQQTRSDASYGERTYVAMLRAFNTGVHRSSKSARVLAGATAPRGGGDAYSTTPQTFARVIKSMGATKYCQGYSHHPYVPRGTRSTAPTAKPNNPRTCVTLGNLNQLTSLFPGKPFYLTEYGYGTHASDYFGCSVSTAKQAAYLKQAYAFARKIPQVKALLWFLVQDWSRTGGTAYNGDGAYTGLIDLKGQHKPAWAAFRAVK
jgi:hypothetical protein